MKLNVTIIGRPNVGKSTLFNRLTKTRKAIVANIPGVTRDINCGYVHWKNIPFIIRDTGGVITNSKDSLVKKINQKVKNAIIDSDITITIFDGKTGPLPFDKDIIDLIRKHNKPNIFVINKVDQEIENDNIRNDFFSLGISKIYTISAEHGYGITTLLDDLISIFPKDVNPDNLGNNLPRICVVGKPNAGKSSLINSITGREQLIVSNIPGTTIDSIDFEIKVNDKKYLITDTAGIRRKNKIFKKIEKFSVSKALKSVNNCDIALIIIDATQGISDQDLRIAGYALDKGRGIILVLNKWDLMNNVNIKKFNDQIRTSIKFLNFAPILNISSLTGLRVKQIFYYIDNIYKQYSNRINTGILNRIIQKAIKVNKPAIHNNYRLKFYYTIQVTTKPPTIVCFVNHPESIHFSYKRYLINKIRKDTLFKLVPIKLIFKQKINKQ